jgi:hypothetical protein
VHGEDCGESYASASAVRQHTENRAGKDTEVARGEPQPAGVALAEGSVLDEGRDDKRDVDDVTETEDEIDQPEVPGSPLLLGCWYSRVGLRVLDQAACSSEPNILGIVAEKEPGTDGDEEGQDKPANSPSVETKLELIMG